MINERCVCFGVIAQKTIERSGTIKAMEKQRMHTKNRLEKIGRERKRKLLKNDETPLNSLSNSKIKNFRSCVVT